MSVQRRLVSWRVSLKVQQNCVNIVGGSIRLREVVFVLKNVTALAIEKKTKKNLLTFIKRITAHIRHQ